MAGLDFSLSLSGVPVLVVGGGSVRALRRAGAVVRRVDPGLLTAADLDGVRLCLLGTDAPAGAAEMVREHGVLVGALPHEKEETPAGRVWLVGAGPGTVDLLTVEAVRRVRAADVILFDRLVGAEVLALARPDALMIDVGKRCGRHTMPQAAINRLLVEHARRGADVVRLKGGDPLVFGRGGEEIAALRAAGVPVTVVPGITAACAAAASLGVPLTSRDGARAVHLVTGHGRDGEEVDYPWSSLALADATLALYMGTVRLGRVTARMLDAGVPPDLPAVAVEDARGPLERRVAGTVATIAALVAAAAPRGPTLLLFGRALAGAAAADPAAEERALVAA